MDKIEYKLEFPIRASAPLLYNYLSTPDGLSEWFADNVNSRGEKFYFIWEGSEESATLLSKKNNSFIKFKWDEQEDENTFFEFRIEIEEITKDVSLMVTDFADKDELEEAKMLWESQINDLHHIIGG